MPPPPPMMPPPMFFPPPPPPRQGRSFVRGIFTTLGLGIFSISLMLNFYLLIFSGVGGVMSGSGASARQSVIEAGDPTETIAVIPVYGVIMDDQAAQFDRFISMAEEDEDVKAVIIAVDSPGGSVTASDVIHHRIQAFKQSRNIPVVISMGSLAASGGYYIACAGDHVVAQPTTLTGNIGVLLPSYNVHELADEWGIRETTIHSSGSDFKNAGSMFQPPTTQETDYFQDIIDQAFAQFKKVVQAGRTGKGSFNPAKLDEIANGKIYTASDAKALGLIDQIGYEEDALATAQQLASLSSPHIVQYHNPPTLFDVLSSQASTATPQSAAGVKLDASGVNLKIDMETIHELSTPRMMYLWRGR